ncbi:J domain-containing protein [Streptomyces olivaceoviridis]|uniref:J domain-containing protein n=1 Tax=Streptomyces olivaceoviridis TaxID=1921 RepID=UPI0036F6AA9C
MTRTVEPDRYAVLGVAPSATAGAITSAFRRRAWELRPDTRADAVTAARFNEVRTAYETLRDPVRRAVCDRACERSSRHRHRHRAPSGAAAASPPSRLRYLFVPGGAAPEPPLRAGPVHWEPGERP